MAIKFLPDNGLFKREKLFYENRQALEGEAAAAFIPVMYDAFEGSPAADVYSEEDDSIPPSLVLERGNFTLAVLHCAARREQRSSRTGAASTPAARKPRPATRELLRRIGCPERRSPA